MKLLYAEDEAAMSEAVVDILTYHNYMVDAVADGADALAYARLEHYDGIILDIMMPKLSGLEVLRQLRAEGCRTPILLLTAKGEIEDQVQGLDLGADDYLPKPFSMELLLARVRALLRRREAFTPSVLKRGNISLNQHICELSCNGRSFVLPRLEYQLLSRDAVCAVLPAGHPAGKSAVQRGDSRELDLSSLTGETFLLQKRTQRQGQYLYELMRRQKVTPARVLETSNIRAAFALAVNGYGVAFLAEGLLRRLDQGQPFDAYRLTGGPSMDFVAAWRKGSYLPAFAQDFIRLMQEV